MAWRQLKRFLTAEEVPRWFGLSLVLIYLVGLGSVAHFGVSQARQEGAVYFQRGSSYAVRLLAEQLSTLEGRGPSDPKLASAYQRALWEFAANVPVRWLRVVDAASTGMPGRHRVIASTDPTEIGTEYPAAENVASCGPDMPLLDVTPVPVSGQFAPDTLICTRLAIHQSGPAESDEPDADDRDPTSLGGGRYASAGGARRDSRTSDMKDSRTGETRVYLEARLPPEPPGVSSLADQARTLAIVLVVLGALFVVYRCLREQLRGMSRIADRLRSLTFRGSRNDSGHASPVRDGKDRLEADLDSLHIADTLDGITSAWNELIDLAQLLAQNVHRSEADKELSNALERSSGGARAEALCAVPDGIIYITDEIRFEYVNSAACRLFGWSSEQATQTTLPEAQAEGVGAKVLDLLRNTLKTEGVFEAHTEVLAAEDNNGGDPGSYRVRIIPLKRTHRQGECVVLIRDVSQQVRAERAREEFITQVTHELRTPLTNIRAYAETLSSDMFDDPNLITECYNVITKETRRLSRLVEDILSVSQLEVGTIELQRGSVDLKTLLSDAVRDVRGLADEKNIDIQLVLPSKLEPINADRDKLAVVANNLLGNAIKYTPPEGNIILGCQLTGGEVVLTVKDNGIGIDPADHERVFEKFQRAFDPAVQDQTGTGIGLYTAREIVRRHGGEIELISEKGQGSTFLVRLPHEASRDWDRTFEGSKV